MGVCSFEVLINLFTATTTDFHKIDTPPLPTTTTTPNTESTRIDILDGRDLALYKTRHSIKLHYEGGQ
jgi:hypothetical protein